MNSHYARTWCTVLYFQWWECCFRRGFCLLCPPGSVPNSLCHHIATEVSSLFGFFRLVLNLTSSNAFQLPPNGFPRPFLLFQYIFHLIFFLCAKFLESWLVSVWLWKFFDGDSKLARFLAKNQPTEKKFVFCQYIEWYYLLTWIIPIHFLFDFPPLCKI